MTSSPQRRLGGVKRLFIVFPLGALLHGSVVAQAASAPVVHVIKDIEYQNTEPSERADVYLPFDASRKVPIPAVIWMHGNHHDKADDRERNICSQLAGAGYVAISINYGSWPDSDVGEEHSPRILQNIANARNAVRFFRTHSTDYGIAPAQIALFGGSAGAWLALMVGLTNGDTRFDSSTPYPAVSSAVSAIGDFYADTDPWLISRITAKSPPVLIVHGKADLAVNYHDSVTLSDTLADFEVPRELVLLENVGHGFDFTTWQKKPLPQDLRPIVLAFLRKHLVSPAGNSSNRH
jgi:acetyl esterase/lipase